MVIQNSNRLLKTKIGDVTSGSNPILLGVPQGSILGPIFFIYFFILIICFIFVELFRLKQIQKVYS
jgi:hypothetical protein